jgi:G:T-mismatch repair DNA endonuclease (very short patch repair protein)
MADVHTKEIRSYNMSQIKGKNTKPEMLVRRFLHANGYRNGTGYTIKSCRSTRKLYYSSPCC